MDISISMLLLLFVVAIIAGWVDIIAGGGGLLTVPALLLTQMPPATALATNKLQGSAGTFVASLYFIRHRLIDLKKIRWAILATFIGSFIGTFTVLQIDSKKLMIFLPILLIAMGFYFLFSPKISDEDKEKRISFIAFALLICPIIGFYDGFLGPGTGSFMALSFVLLCGYGLPKATANAKILNFTSNIASLICFSIIGEFHFLAGIAMILGQFIGASLGARTVHYKGTKLIRPITIAICFLMSANIIIRAIFNHS